MSGSRQIGDLVDFPTSPHKTGDNDTYVRRWWEVPTREVGVRLRWIPYAKGGGSRRWYGLIYDVVDWSPEALRFYKDNSSSSMMKRNPDAPIGITYSMLTSGMNTFRLLPAGAAFDMGGPGFYPARLSAQQVLAVLNSDLTRIVLYALNPTLNLQIREVKQISIPEFDAVEAERLNILVDKAVDVSAKDWDSEETSWGFKANALVVAAQTETQS